MRVFYWTLTVVLYGCGSQDPGRGLRECEASAYAVSPDWVSVRTTQLSFSVPPNLQLGETVVSHEGTMLFFASDSLTVGMSYWQTPLGQGPGPLTVHWAACSARIGGRRAAVFETGYQIRSPAPRVDEWRVTATWGEISHGREVSLT